MGHAAFRLYNAAMYLLLPVILARYLFKGFRRSVYFNRFSQRFGFAPKISSQNPIWVHAVSVGEVNAAAVLVDELLKNDHQVVISCVTPTGFVQIQKKFKDSVACCYAPIDAGVFVTNFLSRVNPRALIILETELWPNLIRVSAKMGIPVSFANMRLSDRTYRLAQRSKSLFKFVTSDVKSFNVQTKSDRDRIEALGVDSSRVHVTGNLKFETAVVKDLEQRGATLRERWGSRPTMILGSSHEGEERIVLEVFERLRSEYADLVCIVVPRHPERFDSVYAQLNKSDYQILRRTQWNNSLQDNAIDIVLVDSMGELMEFFSAADIAIVGGSFVDVGGHNVLEPIIARRPVIFGPHMSNFSEVAELVNQIGAGKQVSDAEGIFRAIKSYLDDAALRWTTVENGQRLLGANRGALQRTMENLSF